MFRSVLKTDSNDFTPLVLRVILGVVISAHGAQKLFGIWGGHGPEWTVDAWHQWWGLPSVLTYLVIFIESIGATLMILGLLTRFWAILIGIIMLGAIYLVHWRWGFYMNWYMQPQVGEGFEYHILVLSILLVLVLRGGGKWSLDGRLSRK
ncbi:DoxX family membrane protein [Muricauda sp. JGD-17]|uniref:DoxX family membrane protein n=1 Tax=Flagellimonas ochracea TaxID=2696472 RepID=A0A964TAH4_9FLAO|nr:DoxX family protein [Allomuricauda ochracea]NAY91272.1 DoxX family membrane protein [Allomuricauda ochracea]